MTIKQILEEYRTIAVVGLSSSTWRPSYTVSKYMQTNGYRIIPVNPLETEVLGERAYRNLDEVAEPFEIVNVFRRSEYCIDIVEAAIRRRAKVIWMQEGVVNVGAAERAVQAGLDVIMNRCILKEHMREGM